MIHGKRMILKGSMEIGHGWMTGIARLGKDAEIGKPKPFYQFCIGRDLLFGADLTLPGMRQKNCKE